jgi:hypothetical protein
LRVPSTSTARASSRSCGPRPTRPSPSTRRLSAPPSTRASTVSRPFCRTTAGQWAATSLADCALSTWLYYGSKLTRRGDEALTKRKKLARYAAFTADQPLVQKVQADMDEAFQASMVRWKAEQAAMNAST